MAQALFVLSGGDSPWHKSHSGPADTQGVQPSPKRATALPTSRHRPAVRSPHSITAGTVCGSGHRIYARHSSSGSHSAGPAPACTSSVIHAAEPEPLWWTISSHTGATGRCLLTQATTSPSASIITTRKQRWKWPKNGGKNRKISAKPIPALGAGAHAGHRRTRTGQATACVTLPPG